MNTGELYHYSDHLISPSAPFYGFLHKEPTHFLMCLFLHFSLLLSMSSLHSARFVFSLACYLFKNLLITVFHS